MIEVPQQDEKKSDIPVRDRVFTKEDIKALEKK